MLGIKNHFVWKAGSKPAWFDHVICLDTLSKVTLQGTAEGGRKRGRQRNQGQLIDWDGCIILTNDDEANSLIGMGVLS